MKLGKLERLMARLSLKMQSSQLHQLRFSCSELSESQKMEAQSPIKLLVILKRKSRSNEHFVNVLEQQFEGSEDFEDLSKIVQEFRSENPDPNEIEPLSGPILPNGAFVFHPEKDQSRAFKRMLLNVSNSINWIHLEIMVAITPIPDSLKEHINKGYQLFDELKRHGCISENDTELLDEVFTLFNVQTPIQLLRSYQEQYPQTIFPDPSPSAPAFATPPLSLQPRSSYPSPSQSTSSFRSLPSVHTPIEAGGASYISRWLPNQPHSLPHRSPTYPRPPQTTSPQHRISSTYPRPPATSATFSALHSSHQTESSSSTTQPSSPSRPSSAPPFIPQIPYPTSKSLEERRKRHQEERGGDQSTDPLEERPPAVKRTREMTNFPSPSTSSYRPPFQGPDSLPESRASSLSSVGSSLPSCNSKYEFPFAIAAEGGPLPEQGQRPANRTLAEQQETVITYQVSEGQARVAPSQSPFSRNTSTAFTPLNSSRALEHHRNTYRHPHSTGAELSRDEEPHRKPHAYAEDSYLTDKERLVYRVHRAEGQSSEESGERGSEKLLGPHGSLTSRGEFATVHAPVVHGTPPAKSINLAAQQQTSTRPPDGYSEPHASQQVYRAEGQSSEESGERGPEKFLGLHGSLMSRVECSHANVFERPPVRGTPPMSMNLAARQYTTTRPPDGYSEPHASQQVHRAEGQSSEESGERGPEKFLGLHGSLTSQVECSHANVLERPPVRGTPPKSMNLAAKQYTTRPPDGYSEPSRYPHSRREPEAYSQPASCSESGNSELAVHRSSSGQPIRQASSQSNVAIGGTSTEQRYDEPPSYISQHHLPGTREPFVGIQPRSYELPSGSTLGSSLATNDLFSSESSGSSHQGGTMLSQPSTGGQFVGIQPRSYELPSGSSLATNDLLSSESSGSSHQGSTMLSQPSTAGLLHSIEERRSEEEEEEEQEPQLKRVKQEESSTLPTEEKQPRSWTSRLFTKVLTTLSWGAQKEKENEDSDDSFKSCDDDDETS